MKSGSLFPVMLLALGTLAPWAVEGDEKSFKAGVCPHRTPAQCFRYEKPKCHSDWQCVGKKKCCPDVCGIKCLDPVNIWKPGRRPGRCPVVLGQCMMLHPPNHCDADGQCQGDLKCCKGMCGKVCVSPLRA